MTAVTMTVMVMTMLPVVSAFTRVAVMFFAVFLILAALMALSLTHRALTIFRVR